MGAVGGILQATGDHGVHGVGVVKSPAIQRAINNSLGTYNSNVASGQAALGDYISQYLAGNKTAADNTAQETGAINQFYDGSMANKLAALRQNQSSAVLGAAKVAGDQAIANSNRANLTSGGGPSSYQTRQLMGSLMPIQAQAALTNAQQERSDTNYLTQEQLGLAGTRTALQNQLAQRALVPAEMQQQFEGTNLGQLGQITNLNNANNIYGVQQNENQWADIANSMDQGILNGVSAYSSIAGGMGKARGGMIRGPGTGTSDSIPIHVSTGEYIVPAAAVRMPGVLALLERIRRMAATDSTAPRPIHRGTRFAGGGLAGSAQQLGDDVTRNLTPQWESSTPMIPTYGQPPQTQPAGGGIGGQPTDTGVWQPTSEGLGSGSLGSGSQAFASKFGASAVPTNFDQLPPSSQQQYVSMYARAAAERDIWGAGATNPYE